MPETPTEVLDGAIRFDGTQQRQALPPSKPPRHRVAWIAAAVAFTLLVLAAVAVIILSNHGNKKSTAQIAMAAATVYQSKLSGTLTPIVSANKTLSQALQAVDGSKPTLRAATNANQAAQQQTVAARGALAAIAVPASQAQLNQQATEALTQETGYLEAVSSTLSDPLGSAPSSLQPLASATSAAFVPLATFAPGGSTSVYGIDNLQKWVTGAKAAADRQKKPDVIVTPGPTTTTFVPTPTPTPTVSGSSYSLVAGLTGFINVRSGPSQDATVVGTIDPSAVVTIDCTAEGGTVDFRGSTYTLWDHIVSPYAGYVSDALVQTGTSGPVAPRC